MFKRYITLAIDDINELKDIANKIDHNIHKQTIKIMINDRISFNNRYNIVTDIISIHINLVENIHRYKYDLSLLEYHLKFDYNSLEMIKKLTDLQYSFVNFINNIKSKLKSINARI